jgi:UDP-glucose:(heptosyl)LPS alpha-1,3-glucosyltransferase
MGADGPRKLRIAILLDRFTPSRGGENYFSWLAGALSEKGHEVHVFAMKVEKGANTGYAVHLIPVWKYPRSLMLLSFIVNSSRILRPYKFDIIHGVGWSLAMNVFNPHGGVEEAYLKQEFRSITNPLYYAYKLLKRYLSLQHHLKIRVRRRQYRSESVKKIIAISKMIKRNIIDYHGTPEKKIAVIFNAVDLDRFHVGNAGLYREKKRESLGIDPGAILLVFAGNNYRLKGLEPLLGSLVYLRRWFPKQPFRLIVLGRGQLGRYRRKAGRLGVSDLTLFPGAVSRIEEYYAAGDIYVHPTFYDSCSLTVLEALASGIPVITSRFNGAADAILSEEGGKIIDDPHDVENLARSIAYYFDEDRRKKARIVTRQWMERYSPGYNLEETLRVYYEVVNGERELPKKTIDNRQGEGGDFVGRELEEFRQEREEE